MNAVKDKAAEWQEQEKFCDIVKNVLLERYGTALAYVRTYGCQQNVSDGERIKGMLTRMGYGITRA